jgi:hypothetical protein
MTRRLHQYELPARFIERFRPVKTQPRDKGLAVYLFDAYGLTFYRHMTTAGAIPDAAIWSVIPPEGRGGLQLAHGQRDTALGYVIAQAVPEGGDPASYPLPVRLGYRAKVAVQALHRLRDELARSQQTAAEVLALIDRRIDAYHHPAACP